MFVCDHHILTTRCPQGKLGPYFTPYAKNNPKWIKDIHVGTKSTKFLKENLGAYLYDCEFDKRSLNTTPKLQVINGKQNYSTSLKLKLVPQVIRK